MTDALPAPLVRAEVDLRDFGYMPLDALRLRDSELAIEASPEVFRASVLLWCAAWHQVPAGSLPDKDKTLAEYSRAGARWPRIREEVLSKWVRCSDGRLYHPVVAEKAREAQSAKDAQKARTKAATEAREAKRRAAHHPPDDPPHASRHDVRDVERDEQRDVDRNVVQGKGREGKGIEEIPPTPKGAGRFPEFWDAWPKSTRKGGKADCERVWRTGGLDAVADTIVGHVLAMAETVGWTKQGGEFIPAPVVYLRGKRWDGADLNGVTHDDGTFAGSI